MWPECGRMRTHWMLHFAALAGCLAASPVPAQTSSTTDFSVVGGVPIVNDVFLNGHGPYRFVLDTGSDTNLIDARLVRKLGLRAGLTLGNVTPSGESRVAAGVVDEVAVGPAKAERQEFLVAGAENVAFSELDAVGIVGQEFLRHFDYTLDWKHRRVDWGGTPPGGERLPFRVVSNCMVIATDAGELLLDSGSTSLLLFRNGVHPGRETVVTANGEFTAAQVMGLPIRIGGRKYHADRVVFHEVPNRPADGALPANLFRAVYVSNSGGYLVLNPEGR